MDIFGFMYDFFGVLVDFGQMMWDALQYNLLPGVPLWTALSVVGIGSLLIKIILKIII